MKAQHISYALLAVVIFSCKRETAPLITNKGLAATADSQTLSLQQTYVATSTVGGAGTYFSADFNGDGYSDVIESYSNNGLLAIRVFDVSGSGTFLLCDQTDSLDNTSITNKGMLAGDYDGDGKADFIQCWNNNEHMGIRVFKSTGTSFYKAYEATMVEMPYNLGLLAVDIDGDGKTDIAQTYVDNTGHFTIKIYHSTGTGFEEYAKVGQSGGNLSEGLFAADWDGDGKSEIVQTWNNAGKLGYFVYHSTNGRTYSYAYSDTSIEASTNTPLIPLDYNSDGKADFLQTWNNNGNINVILYQSDGSSYTEIGNFATVPGKTYQSWLRVKRPGQRDGLLKVWGNNGKTAFYRFDFVD